LWQCRPSKKPLSDIEIGINRQLDKSHSTDFIKIILIQGGAVSLNNKKERHLEILDWIRGVAAVLVCASHLRNAMIVDWVNAHDHGLINKILYGITGLGHQSVMVFLSSADIWLVAL
jgi:hypothetical protein